jgi:hypothetical protein
VLWATCGPRVAVNASVTSYPSSMLFVQNIARFDAFETPMPDPKQGAPCQVHLLALGLPGLSAWWPVSCGTAHNNVFFVTACGRIVFLNMKCFFCVELSSKGKDGVAGVPLTDQLVQRGLTG